MKILDRWLKQYIRYSFAPDQLAERLTMLGLEFESIEHLGRRYEGFVVGEVLARERHPNADKLSVCSVAAGNETLRIVCGAANVAAGQKVAVGLVGATVPRNPHYPDGPPFVLSRISLRGVESAGMICSEYELDLGKDADGILVLDAEATVGQSLASYLGMDDVAYDIEITPNRPDWLSHIGVAREIGILTGRPPVLPVAKVQESKDAISRYLSVRVEDPVNCPRFAVRMIRGVSVGPSPRWLQNALRNVGLRPRNNVVDITNYVMYECGHPMHAFDHALLRGGRIIVRPAAPGTSFVTLDGKSHVLPAGTVMVCDGEREVSVAGVMGGANSEISDATVDVVLEAAYWNPSSIRRTAKALGISSDASQRFERGADPNAVRYALDRAAGLIMAHAGGSALKGVIDVYPRKIREKLVPVRVGRVNAVLGTRLRKKEVVASLTGLGMRRASEKGDALKFMVPTFRVDCEREIDLIEEVARVYGYDRIEERTAAMVNFAHPFPTSSPQGTVRALLIGRGFQEAITNSMQAEGTSMMGGASPVRILNPQNQDMTTLRTSLLPGLLETVARNQDLGNSSLRLFEIGHVFSVDNSPAPKFVENFLEEERLCVVMTGLAEPLHWSGASRECDMFDIKGEIQDVIAKFALDKSRLISYSTTNGLTDNTLAIEIQGSYAGYLGQIKKDVRKRFGIEKEVFVAELALGSLLQKATREFKPLPRYPGVRRDVAFSVDASVPAEDLERTIWQSATDLVQAVELFDVYEGVPLPAGTKSVAFALSLMSREKTLTDAEIESSVRRIVDGVTRAHNAVLRSVE